MTSEGYGCVVSVNKSLRAVTLTEPFTELNLKYKGVRPHHYRAGPYVTVMYNNGRLQSCVTLVESRAMIVAAVTIGRPDIDV